VTFVKKQRFLFVDGLRGIAAISVVWHHFREAVNESASHWIEPVVEQVLSYGYLGVDIFFVISGFVISFSVRNAEHTLGFLFRFGVRRSIRLDPPYWLTIFIELVAIKIGLMLFPQLSTPFPSMEKILAHFVYAQGILGYDNIINVFWTLCYEVQFYLVFVGALVLARALRQWSGKKIADRIMLALATLTFVWSVAIFFTPVQSPVQGLFLNRWYQFFLGYLAMRCYLEDRILPGFVGASAIVLCLSLIASRGAINELTALVIAWLFVAAARRRALSTWLSSKVIQFLGRISYSLYLIHSVVGWRTIKLLRELNGADFTPIQAWLALGAGVGVSIFSAWLMYRFIEVPALRVCHGIRLDRPLTAGAFRGSLRLLRR
jgi:peptidoglycan/LPS O-acetylase OafA/YrhL